ncbi:GGDEF domain-containing protein [Devosia sp. YIM 151766]|uniref:GGDEF domain-containing protein n=1 Tax=Devosia sp. YIM 151766 TaxID=3017325 RepID=UPI00255CB017|nr:GGDEF domain-containing protein [Devosia sp. YIM 151766]WIY51691.1 GGDEF domain-containing protein [Devosia sp. YIM 151766]
MGLDIPTLFVANIFVLAISSVAYISVFVRSQGDRYWLYWIAANVVLAASLAIYLSWPELPAHMAIIPDALLVLGFALRHAAARLFAGRAINRWPFGLVPLFMAASMGIGHVSFGYALTNIVLAGLAVLVAWEFWRDRGDRLFSRFGLVSVYGLMTLSFGARAGQGMLASDQVQSYIPYDAFLEMHLLVALIHVIAGSLFVLSLASERSAEALREVARRDPLTGLFNRRAFETQLAQYLGRSDVAVALVDVDHFKAVNDRFGHAAGDLVLKAVAEALAAAVGAAGHVARIGGEEFAIVLPGVDVAAAEAAAERARRAVENCHIGHGGQVIGVTVSVGVAHAGEPCETADDFLESADRALYGAKADGRNICAMGAGAAQQYRRGIAALAS